MDMTKPSRPGKKPDNLTIKLSVLLLSGVFLAGCVATTTDIDRLQDSLNQVQKGQADLISKMDDLDRTIETLNEKLTVSDKKMSILASKLDDSQSALGGRMESISQLLSEATSQAKVAVPGDAYRSAYGDYLSGKLSLAIEGFSSFIKMYPDSDLADDAQFYLAANYLLKKDYKTARVEFDNALAGSREFRPQALLKRAYALKGSGQTKDQKLTLEALIKEFPKSPESEAAKEILRELSPPKKTPKE